MPREQRIPDELPNGKATVSGYPNAESSLAPPVHQANGDNGTSSTLTKRAIDQVESAAKASPGDKVIVGKLSANGHFAQVSEDSIRQMTLTDDEFEYLASNPDSQTAKKYWRKHQGRRQETKQPG